MMMGGKTGFLLLHGFTSMPEEVRPLAEHLAGRGHTVLAQRLAGHGSHPDDLKWVSWSDWLLDVEDVYRVLRMKNECLGKAAAFFDQVYR